MREPVAGEKLDQYELGELLARSGMASIFRAVDAENGAAVALKIPHPQLESDVGPASLRALTAKGFGRPLEQHRFLLHN